MLHIGNYIISQDLFEKKFACDLPSCLGNCCRYGDAGAPLSDEEVKILREIKDIINPYLRDEGRDAILQQGTSLRDIEGEMVTPLIEGQECAYTVMEGNIFKCAIEKAWIDGRINFRKPLSCHLFPVRIKKYESYTAVNVEEWPVCFSGRMKGKKEGIYIYEFLAEALKRALGEKTYMEICIAAREINKLS
ncbi:MAG: DUF3109 family protein [Bacteroidales bacterium]